ncbi:hypothetical protein Leryth_024485 [Lithospermum erythrorhizon]|nr:hypothetical protein Leryth_024485 [Lithospermum erythrorhizon]
MYVVSCTRMSAWKWTLASTLQKWRKCQFLYQPIFNSNLNVNVKGEIRFSMR